MNQEPAESAYDLRFEVFGIPTRVTWGFWVAAVVLGWGDYNSWDAYFAAEGVDSPGATVLLIIWSAAIFVSILVHELGHALVMKYYGLRPRMVLYHFGGLAITNSIGSWDGARRRSLTAKDSLLVSAAGPVAQLLLAAVVYIAGRALGMQMELDWILSYYFQLEVPDVGLPSSAAVFAIFNSLVTPSVFWALLNLLPILPMDGGHIMRETMVLTRNRDPQRNSHLVSIFIAVAVSILCLQAGQSMLAMMCLLFAATNWQQLQFMSGRF